MNKRMTRLLTDGLIALVLVVVWRFINIEQVLRLNYSLPIMLGLIPLIWIALRHGGAFAILVAAIAGLVNTLLASATDLPFISRLLLEVTPLLVVGCAGFFAKYTQKTLNNRRLTSTRLNIATASMIVSVAAFIIRYIALPLILSIPLHGVLWHNATAWGAAVLTAVIATLILCLVAQFKPDWIIPKRSKYLSRKETSRLLND
ncbi:energy-coupled thiamine transporter ThiT [Tuanshanicoccus lijuaniae]|uniref:energy-coupled thiamine transporter ThiT n=1 Tax=Aerococcaceae bacterium zg-1292 TaxID=2774330 RepID=UPI001937F3BC|nr:energy-coupled thiamine transporter ThiT [Aerococcaceae bacterium zg-1292]MBF6626575.1 energy-coupled thiamine transporter ThiT [Aerococcaceae bacterium zg-BR9]MBF6978940.1 energy-coupled thiamine transporter ThiT [Aerococcaceae bacterium zg-BR22]QQA36888.1 energy-coupled thiamine transporter ThiT [Aerococcaceae bacterium zg-1292]